MGALGLGAVAAWRFTSSRLSISRSLRDDETLDRGPGFMHCMTAGPPLHAGQDRNPLKGLQKGSLVVFRNSPQVAVVQPYGNGREYLVESTSTGVRVVPTFYGETSRE